MLSVGQAAPNAVQIQSCCFVPGNPGHNLGIIKRVFTLLHPFADITENLSKAETKAKALFIKCVLKEGASPKLCALLSKTHILGQANNMTIFRAICYRLLRVLSSIEEKTTGKCLLSGFGVKEKPAIPLFKSEIIQLLSAVENSLFRPHEHTFTEEEFVRCVEKAVEVSSPLLEKVQTLAQDQRDIGRAEVSSRVVTREFQKVRKLLIMLKEFCELENSERVSLLFPLRHEMLAYAAKLEDSVSVTKCLSLRNYLDLASCLEKGVADVEFGLNEQKRGLSHRQYRTHLEQIRADIAKYTRFFAERKHKFEELDKISSALMNGKLSINEYKTLARRLRDNLLPLEDVIGENIILRAGSSIGLLYEEVIKHVSQSSELAKDVLHLRDMRDWVFTHGGFLFDLMNEQMHQMVEDLEVFCTSAESILERPCFIRKVSGHTQLDSLFVEFYRVFHAEKSLHPWVDTLHLIHEHIARALCLPDIEANRAECQRLLNLAKRIFIDELIPAMQDLDPNSDLMIMAKVLNNDIVWDRQFFMLFDISMEQGVHLTRDHVPIFQQEIEMMHIVQVSFREKNLEKLADLNIKGAHPRSIARLLDLLDRHYHISSCVQGSAGDDSDLDELDSESDHEDSSRGLLGLTRGALITGWNLFKKAHGDPSPEPQHSVSPTVEEFVTTKPQPKFRVVIPQTVEALQKHALKLFREFDEFQKLFSKISFSDLSTEQQERYQSLLIITDFHENLAKTILRGVLRCGRELDLVAVKTTRDLAPKPKPADLRPFTLVESSEDEESVDVFVDNLPSMTSEFDPQAGGRLPCEVELTRSLEPLVKDHPSLTRVHCSISLLLHQARVESPHRYSHAAALTTNLLLEGVLVHRLEQTGGVPPELVGTHKLSDMASVLKDRAAIDESFLPLINSFDCSIASKLGRCQPIPNVAKFPPLENSEQTVERARRDLLAGMQLAHQLLGNAPFEFCSPRLECSVGVKLTTSLQRDLRLLEQNFGEASPLVGESLFSRRIRKELLSGAFVHLVRTERALLETSTPTYVDIKSRLFLAVQFVKSASALVYCYLPIAGDGPHTHVVFTTVGEDRRREVRHSDDIHALCDILKGQGFQLSEGEERVMANFSRFCSHEHSYADESASSVGKVMLELESLERLKQAYTFEQGFIAQDLESLSREFTTTSDIDKRLVDLNEQADKWVKELMSIGEKIIVFACLELHEGFL